MEQEVCEKKKNQKLETAEYKTGEVKRILIW